MRDLLSKTKFINALVREHVAQCAARVAHGREPASQYLRLDILIEKDEPARLVMRGNTIGTHWLILADGMPHSLDGLQQLHRVAVDIAFAAADRASRETGEPAAIGLPPVELHQPWFQPS
jgi:hypothetical protein